MKKQRKRNYLTRNLILIFFLFFLSFYTFTSSASAATCNDIADGDWNSTATWDCGLVPGGGDDVTIDSHIVTITADQSAGSVTIAGGTLNMGSYILSDYGDWTYSSGTFNAGTSTLKITGATNISFNTNGESYYNLEFKKGYQHTDLGGNITVLNNLVLNSVNQQLNSYKIYVAGDIKNIQSSGGTTGSTVIEINGSNDQTISSSGSFYPSITVNKSAGTLKMIGTVPIYGNWNYSSGTLNAGTSTLKIVGSISVFNTNGESYYNLEFNKGASHVDLGGNITVLNNLVLNSVNQQLNSYKIYVAGDIKNIQSSGGTTGSTVIEINGSNDQTISSSGSFYPSITVNKSAGTLKMIGTVPIYGSWNWKGKGKLNAGTSKINFNGAGTFFTGNQNYYDVEVSNVCVNFNLGSNLNVLNELKISIFSCGNFKNTSGNYKITTKDFIQTGGTVLMGSGSLKVLGDFTRTGGTFDAGTSVVALLGNNQTIDVTGADTTFYKLYKLVNQDDTLTITAGNNLTIASGGVMRFWGKPEGKTLSVVSSSPGTPYNITKTGTAEIEYTNWSDANWNTATVASASTLGTGNTNLSVTKEFVSTIRASGGDYSTLSSWEAAVNCDLTASTTKVFSHSGIAGSLPDNSTVTGVTSGATGTAVHTTATQILIKDITGTFQSGEQVQIDGSNYVTISDTGYGAIATAEPYNDWPTGLDDQVSINGWTTNANHYVKIYVPKSQRHNGTLKDGAGNYTGFALVATTDSYILIDIYEPYLVIDGLILDSQTNYAYGMFIQYSGGSNSDKIKNNIISNFGKVDVGYDGLTINDYRSYEYIENNIFIKARVRVSSTRYSSNYNYFNNNTFYNCGLVADNKGATIAKNNIVYNSSFVNPFNADSSNNISSNSTAPGDNSLQNITLLQLAFLKTIADNENLHIAKKSVAVGAGADLSVDPNYPVIDDIDGNSRLTSQNWDIGADQSATKIYRSVGPSKTSDLQDDNSHADTLVISNDNVTFSTALADNIGVGDVIVYDSDLDDTLTSADSLAFITGRTDSTHYTVQTQSGTIPDTLATNDTWAIYRAYTSLANAEAGIKNTSIPIAFVGGNQDLIASNEQWNIACYANGTTADTTPVTISGWTTSAQNYLKIYTPYQTSEVGVSQRHKGVWDDEKYKRDGDGGITIRDYDVYIEGLQIKRSGGMYVMGIKVDLYGITTPADIRISNNIVVGDPNNTEGYFYGIVGWTDSSSVVVRIWNNIVYDWKGSSNSGGIRNGSYGTYYVDNNTVNNCYIGFKGSNVYTIAKNNIAQNCNSDFSGTFNSASDYNIASNNSAPGTHSKNSATVQFVDAAHYDFHLAPSDTTAKDAGVNLSADSYLPFDTDIDGELRSDPWDIGADEMKKNVYKLKGYLRFKGNVKFK